MARTTDNSGPILDPEQIEELWITPVVSNSVATLDGITTTLVRLDAPSWRAPRVTADPTAAWLTEGQEFPVSDALLDEVVCTPSKIGAFTIVTSEAMEDTSGEAANIVSDGLVRDTVRKINSAFVGDLPDPAPGGLESIDHTTLVNQGLADLSAFASAVALAEDEHGAVITSFLCSSNMGLRLGNLRTGKDSNVPLLSADPAMPTRKIIEGRPLITAPGIPDDTVWAIPADRIRTLIRTEAEVEADASTYFLSDRIAVRGRMRVGYAFLQPEAVIKMTFTPAAETEPDGN